MVDQRLFWQEVKLLAKNNYGPWCDRREAEALIDRAISEVCSNIADSFLADAKTIGEIADEMMES